MDLPSPSDPQRFGGSLAVRLLRVIFGCYFGVAVLVTGIQILTEYRSAHRRLEADVQAMERTFGPGLADALWSYNTGVLHGILTGIVQMPVVTGVEVRDEHGRVIEGIDAPEARVQSGGFFDQPFTRDFVLVHIDEAKRPHPVGRWTVRSNDGIALEQVKGTLIVILVNSVLKTLALWAIFWAVVHAMVGRPLAQIGRFVSGLDSENLGSRPLLLRARGDHELHLLAQAFNAMATKLRGAFDDNAALLRDLTEANATLQARVEERTRALERLARTDQLTGLGNRRDLDEGLERAVGATEAGRRFSVVLADIDHFKSINDRYGHATGDAVLVACADLLRGASPAGGTLGRWGGEEFMLLCPDTDGTAAGLFAEAMRRRMEETMLPTVGALTCSFGVAELRAGDSVDALLARVDLALYEAKRDGRNRVVTAEGGPSADRRTAA
jgi:diguanylate cyclase (GGDEF)-like protein